MEIRGKQIHQINCLPGRLGFNQQGVSSISKFWVYKCLLQCDGSYTSGHRYKCAVSQSEEIFLVHCKTHNKLEI